MEYSVKGSSIRTKIDYARERFGEEAARALAESVEGERVDRILDSSWYPYSLYVAVLRELVTRHFAGDTSQLQDVGSYSAQKALESTYRAFRSTVSYPDFLQRISSLHHMLYSAGKSEVVLGEDRSSCTIVLSGKPELAEEDLNIALGFYLGCGREYGHDRIRGRYRVEGDAAHFSIEWS